MTIKEVEEQLNISRANVRFYEKEGLLAAKRNPLNGYRDYSLENIETIRKILFFRSLEISIEGIRLLQSGETTLDKLLNEHIEFLESKVHTFEEAKNICTKIKNESDYCFETLDIEKYRILNEKNKYSILKDTISNLSFIRNTLFSWLLILLSLLIAIITYPLLPPQIPLNWNQLLVTNEVTKITIFLFPLFSGIALWLARSLVWGILFRQMPWKLVYLDKIAEYVSIYLIIMIVTYQTYVVLFISGFRGNLDYILLAELVLFVIISLATVFFKNIFYHK